MRKLYYCERWVFWAVLTIAFLMGWGIGHFGDRDLRTPARYGDDYCSANGKIWRARYDGYCVASDADEPAAAVKGK